MEKAAKFLDKEVLKEKTPSVQYAFFDTKEVIFEHYAGFLDLKNGIKADRKSTFNIYSVTKVFTALAVLQLVEKGILTLDDPVKQHLPQYNISSKVSIRHLLTHTSGLGNPMPLNWVHLEEEHKDFNRNNFFNP